MRFAAFLALIACAGPALRAADPEPAASQPAVRDAKALLAESGQALLGKTSYRMEQQVTSAIQGSGGETKTTLTMKISGMPGKFRMETSPAGVEVISDGKFTYLLVLSLNQYVKRPAAGSPEKLADALMPGLSLLAAAAQEATTARIVREEPLQFQGKSVDCYVVEVNIGRVEAPGLRNATVDHSRQTIWIDKQRKLTLKEIADADAEVAGLGGPMKTHTETVVTSLDLAPAFAADEFAFTPPEGAKEVEDFPGMSFGARQ